MDSRGNPAAAPISRRSCDQCHSRKIGCDRSSPCSNCVNGRIDCTHSARAAKSTPARQRVLISTQYERKIDDLVRDVNFIKTALQSSTADKSSNEHNASTMLTPRSAPEVSTHIRPVGEEKRQTVQSEKQKNPPTWDHSIQIIDFVKSVAESSTPGNDDKLSFSLKSLGRVMTNQSVGSQVPGIAAFSGIQSESLPIPPSSYVLPLLRWVKAHPSFHRVQWISQILPITMFEEICRKVYFAVEDYSQAEYILAAGYLAYMFSEHRVSTGTESSGYYGQMCRDALFEGLSRLPFILPPTLEVVAALLIATLYSIENSKSMSAWTYISAAVSHCQTLRYHRQEGSSDPRQEMGRDLFLSVYKFEKGLSLRLGRPSGVRDAEITLPMASDGHRSTRSARIQGQVYDQLYSLGGLSKAEERGRLARELSEEVRGVLIEIRAELLQCLDDQEGDVMRELYLRGDLTCHTSLLALILRAAPSTSQDASVSDECIVAAREVFELHQQSMECVRNCNDPPTMARYLNWAILHVPFVPFSILFTQAIQFSDLEDLDRLRLFAESLQPDATSDEKTSTTHPFRLYDLLYQAARLNVESNRGGSMAREAAARESLGIPENQYGSEYINGMGEYDPMLGQISTSMMDLGEWFQGNQQLFRLLDEGVLSESFP